MVPRKGKKKRYSMSKYVLAWRFVINKKTYSAAVDDHCVKDTLRTPGKLKKKKKYESTNTKMSHTE